MDNLRGALLMTASMLGFAFEDAFTKLLTHTLPIGQTLLLLGLIGTAIFAAATLLRGDALLSRRLLNIPFAIRSSSEFFASILYTSAIALTPLAQASAIQQALPLLVTMGAALFMGEQVGWRRWSAIVVGFLGVLIVIQPGTEGFTALSLLSLGSVVWLTVRDLITRRLPPDVSAMQIATWGFAAIIPAGLFMLWLRGETWQPMTTTLWIWSIAGTITGVLGYYALIAAVRIGEISVVTPFRYTRLIFAVLIGWIAFSEPPTTATLIGGAVIVASGLYTLWRQAIVMRSERSASVRR